MGAFKLTIVKFSIRIRKGYCGLYARLDIGFATGKSFRTAPVQVSVKGKREKRRGLYALDPSALAASWHWRGVLDGVVTANLSVFREPDFSREGQVEHSEVKSIPTPPLISAGSDTVCLDKVSTKDGRDLVPQLHGFLIGLGIRPALVLKRVSAHLLAECW